MPYTLELSEEIVRQLQLLQNCDEFVRQAIAVALEQNRKKHELKTVLEAMRTQAEQHQLTEAILSESEFSGFTQFSE